MSTRIGDRSKRKRYIIRSIKSTKGKATVVQLASGKVASLKKSLIRAEAFVDWDLSAAASKVGAGLPSENLLVVRDRLGLNKQMLARVIGISESTVERRRPGTLLSTSESERVYRIGRLTDLAERALGSPDEAREWMKEPNYALGDQVPLDLALTEPGARLVEQSLAAIEYGFPV